MAALDTEKGRQAARLLAHEDLYWFTRYMFRVRKGFSWKEGRHHRIITRKLMDVFEGRCPRLIINIPPRYSKTELAVKNFIAWALGKVPDAEFIHTSYAFDLARANAWEAREIVEHEEYSKIFPGTRVRSDIGGGDHWYTTAGGVVYARQTGAPITGFGAGKMRPGFGGALIIDDPHKADDVRHDQLRRVPIDRYQSTLQSRLNDPENTPVIVIMQRLHEEDLAGWMLDGGTGEKWELLCIPALCESEDDPLGRAIGEPLWEEKHSAQMLRVMERAMPAVFAGQYQQRPSPAEGLVFKPDNLVYVENLEGLRIKRWVRGWDKAATVNGGDWSVGLRLGELEDGRFIIGDVERFQGGPDELATRMRSTAERDGVETWISVPQDPGAAGKISASADSRLLKGFAVEVTPELGDKETRWGPVASQVNLGNVLIVRAEWNAALVHEMRQAPNGKHDDQLDALARAFGRLVGDVSGDAIIPTPSLLLDGQPREALSHCQFTFATVSSHIKTGKSENAIAAVWWAMDENSPWPLTVLDWEITTMDGDWANTWVPSLVTRGQELATRHYAHFGFGGIWVENMGPGTIIIEQARRRGVAASEINLDLIKMGAQEKAASVSGYAAMDKIKLLEPAYARTSMYRGVDRNHLLGQIQACRLGAKEDRPEQELLTAFLDGAMIALGNAHGW